MPENQQSIPPVAIGIDLGTSTSCVCACVDGKSEILSNHQGERITPSVVSFSEDGSSLVGANAKSNIIADAQHTVYSAKRLIGRLYDSEEVRKARAVCAFEIVQGPSNDARVRVRDTDYSIPEISALVLREMKMIAEYRLGRPVEQAVVTVPAYFNDNQRQATKDAGRIAGLEVLRIINEPTAAALAYGFGKDMAKKIAVYDLGGGTFDISILEIGKDIFEVLSTGGDTYLGGDDFDDRLLDFLADGFVAEHGINLRRDRLALQKLRTTSEQVKIDLSTKEMTRIEIPDLYQDETGTKGISRTLTRLDFVRLTQDLTDRTFKVCAEALQAAGLMAGDVDAVILVGGPTRLPMIRNAVEGYFGKEPQCHLDPEEVVATGAAIHAASLLETAKPTFLLDVTPLSLRLGITGGLSEVIVEKNTPIPIEQTRTFTTVHDNQGEVSIRIHQGESKVAAENELLGEFEFTGLRRAPRGEVKIEVTFEISAEGIVNVIAHDQETGRRQTTTVRLSSGLTEDEIRRASKFHASRDQNASPPPKPSRPEPSTPSDLSVQDDMADITPLDLDEEFAPLTQTEDLIAGIEPDPDDSKEGGGGS